MADPSPSFTNLVLPAILDLNAAAPLAAEFLALRGSPVAVDASGVERIGGLCLQVLLSVGVTWAVDNVPVRLAKSSPPFTAALALFGTSPFTL